MSNNQCTGTPTLPQRNATAKFVNFIRSSTVQHYDTIQVAITKN